MNSPQAVHFIEYGAMSLTVWRSGPVFLGPLCLTIFDGSKSGGKYFWSTLRSDMASVVLVDDVVV